MRTVTLIILFITLVTIGLTFVISNSPNEEYRYKIEIKYCNGDKDTIIHCSGASPNLYIDTYKEAVPILRSFFTTIEVNVCKYRILTKERIDNDSLSN